MRDHFPELDTKKPSVALLRVLNPTHPHWDSSRKELYDSFPCQRGVLCLPEKVLFGDEDTLQTRTRLSQSPYRYPCRVQGPSARSKTECPNHRVTSVSGVREAIMRTEFKDLL